MAQFGSGRSGCDEFGRERSSVSLAQDGGDARCRPRRCASGEEGEPAASTSPGDPDSKQLRARTHARGAARTAGALDRAPVIHIGSL